MTSDETVSYEFRVDIPGALGDTDSHRFWLYRSGVCIGSALTAADARAWAAEIDAADQCEAVAGAKQNQHPQTDRQDR